MTKEEWWLRLLMISGHKWPHIKQLTATEGMIFDVRTLQHLGFSAEQCEQFGQVDKYDLAKSLDWLEGDDRQLIAFCDEAYPPLLRSISRPPIALFVEGNASVLHQAQIAMVGSRRFSRYGEQWANYFAGELAGCGFVITSGLALGIDGISHRGALAVGGSTAAILGSGLDQLHPKSHLSLARQIVERGGALVSEFLPFEAPKAENFPRRNRIVSGLSLGVLVVEAKAQSGSLITAKYALEQGREVFALPGPLDNENCSGTHSLIQQGAMLVASPADIVENLNGSLRWLALTPPERSITVGGAPGLNEERPPLLQYIGSRPLPVDIIAQRANLSIAEVTVQLVDLELSEWIKSVSGGYVINR
ncbi:DNA-processing protein DprA [Leminorella grimontii]|uniref:DNA-processing protein DprA n=1 Tax=Leminorella grimontii TaxID=82981 RepID=UPI00322033B2